MSPLLLAKVPGNNNPWYSNTLCNYSYAMDTFNKAPSIEKRDEIIELFDGNCANHSHKMIGQNIAEQSESDMHIATEDDYDIFDEIFHSNSVNVSLDATSDLNIGRARVLFIPQDFLLGGSSFAFQFNCHFDTHAVEQSVSRINAAVDGGVDAKPAIATLLLRTVEKIVLAFSAAAEKSTFLQRLGANMPLRLQFDIRPVIRPMSNPQTPYVSTVKEQSSLSFVFRSLSAFVASRQPAHLAIESEADHLLEPLLPPIAEEKKHIGERVDEKGGEPVVAPQNRSCLQLISDFLTALLQTLGECLSACWQKACG